jgi:hypothetical protein
MPCYAVLWFVGLAVHQKDKCIGISQRAKSNLKLAFAPLPFASTELKMHNTIWLSKFCCWACLLCYAVLCVSCSFPAFAKRGYDFLKEEKGFSDMSIIAGEAGWRLLALQPISG